MKDPLKPRDKITQKMTRDGAIAENQTTGDTERILSLIHILSAAPSYLCLPDCSVKRRG